MLEYCSSNPPGNKLTTVSSGSLKDSIGPETANGHLSIVNSRKSIAIFHVYSGYFKIFPIDAKTGRLNHSSSFNASLDEPEGVLDIKFLHGLDDVSGPQVAVLHADHKGRHFLKTYEVDVANKRLNKGAWDR